MNLNEGLSELLFTVIVIMSALIAYEFYKSKDGRLRVLIISLFVCKIWTYGGAMVYYGLLDFGYVPNFPSVYVRLVLNFPMMVVMLNLWKYIRLHNK